MNRSLKFVTVSLFAWGMGEGMFLLFQPIYLLKLGADPIAIGAILGAMGLMTTLAQIPSGYLSDRFGTRPLMWISWVWGTLAAWGMALSASLPLFVISLLLYGLTGSIMAPMNAYITAMRGEWSAERALTFTAAAYHLGTVIGPTLGGFLGQKYDLKILYLMAAIIFIISTTFVFFIKKPQVEIHHQKNNKSSIFRNTSFIRILSLAAIAIFFMVFTQSFAPVFLEDLRSVDIQQIGFLGTIGSIGNVVLALTLGHLPARLGYLLSFPFVFLFPLLIWKGNSFGWYGIGYFIFGGYRLARSMMLAFSRHFIHSRETGLAFGMIETANGIALILAPLICGIIYNQNPQHIFWVAAFGMVFAFIANLLWLPKNSLEQESL